MLDRPNDSFGAAPYEDSGATALSRQPITKKDDRKTDDWEWTRTWETLEATLTSLRAWRWTWWAFQEVVSRFFLPFRYRWLITANRYDRGHPVNDQIKDSTGLQAVRTAAGGMWTGLTSPSRPWFKFGCALPWVKLDTAANEWLKDTQDRVYTVLAQSNFYSSFAQAFEDEITFGTAPIIVFEDDEDVIHLEVPCAGEYFVDVDGKKRHNRIYREFTYNVIQIVDFFKLENCPELIVKLWNEGGGSWQQEFVIAHAIEPNTPIADRKSNDPEREIRVVPASFPWREVYWLRGQKTKHCFSKKGFKSKPFSVLQWRQRGNEPYAFGPCADALGDNKQVQLETTNKAKFIGKGVDPPMGADPALKTAEASIIQAQITYFDTSGGKKGFFPLFELNPQWLPALTADIAQVNARIEKCLYVTLFMAISRMEGVQPRNELELSKRDLERLQELGPVIHQNEQAIEEILQRIYSIMVRRHMIKPPPPSLAGVPLKISFTSIMRLAQRSAESVSMKDTFQVGGLLSSAAKAAGIPDPLRTVNLDKAYRHYADLNEFPASLFFSDGEVAQHDQIRQQEMQKAQAPNAAMAGVTAAKTLADTPMGGNTALSALAGGGGGGGAPPA